MSRWSKAQRGVALGMASGVLITLTSFACAALVGPKTVDHDLLDDRLRILALCFLAPLLALAFAIGRLASHRFRTPQDIDGSGLTAGTEQAAVLQSLLQNTLEQLTLALPSYTAWALLAPAPRLVLLPVASALFLLGRVLFFLGYPYGAAARSLGFALTFYPTLGLLLAAMAASH